MMTEKNDDQKPTACSECIYHGEHGEYLKSGEATFPSLCKKNLLWFQCGGKEGKKKRDADKLDREKRCIVGVIQDQQLISKEEATELAWKQVSENMMKLIDPVLGLMSKRNRRSGEDDENRD